MSGKRPQLVIAVEGVLTSNPLERFWDLVGAATSRSPADVEMQFRVELEEKLFTGAVAEREFWHWLAEKLGLNDERFWRQIFDERRYPLLAMHLLPRLRAQADIYLLCGERSEWFMPLVEEEDLHYAVSKLIFTDRVGINKDDPELWRRLKVAGGDRPRLLVDTDQRAIELAREFGFAALRADPEMLWADAAIKWLDSNSQPSGWTGLVLKKAPDFLRRLNNFGRRVPA